MQLILFSFFSTLYADVQDDKSKKSFQLLSRKGHLKKRPGKPSEPAANGTGWVYYEDQVWTEDQCDGLGQEVGDVSDCVNACDGMDYCNAFNFDYNNRVCIFASCNDVYASPGDSYEPGFNAYILQPDTKPKHEKIALKPKHEKIALKPKNMKGKVSKLPLRPGKSSKPAANGAGWVYYEDQVWTEDQCDRLGKAPYDVSDCINACDDDAYCNAFNYNDNDCIFLICNDVYASPAATAANWEAYILRSDTKPKHGKIALKPIHEKIALKPKNMKGKVSKLPLRPGKPSKPAANGVGWVYYEDQYWTDDQCARLGHEPGDVSDCINACDGMDYCNAFNFNYNDNHCIFLICSDVYASPGDSDEPGYNAYILRPDTKPKHKKIDAESIPMEGKSTESEPVSQFRTITE
jgi:hypothetical protein